MSIIFLILSIICLLIARFNFNKFYWLFGIGLLIFSFTTAYYLITALEHFFHRHWLNINFGLGKELAAKAWLLCGIFAIAIMLGFTYLLKVLYAGYMI